MKTSRLLIQNCLKTISYKYFSRRVSMRLSLSKNLSFIRGHTYRLVVPKIVGSNLISHPAPSGRTQMRFSLSGPHFFAFIRNFSGKAQRAFPALSRSRKCLFRFVKKGTENGFSCPTNETTALRCCLCIYPERLYWKERPGGKLFLLTFNKLYGRMVVT